MSAAYGVWRESDVVSIALFFCCTIPITLLENRNALNLGSGQSPVSRRLLLVQALALPHGLLTVNEDRVCIMNNAVADRIS